MVPHPSPLSLRPLRPCHQQPIIMASPLAEANANFSLALFQKIAEETPTGNVFFSPLSISLALAMVLLGARGNTATQMSEVGLVGFGGLFQSNSMSVSMCRYLKIGHRIYSYNMFVMTTKSSVTIVVLGPTLLQHCVLGHAEIVT